MTGEQGQRWLVTGASRGIGFAIAMAALNGGGRVAFLSRGGAELPQGHDGRAMALRADVTKPADLQAAAEALSERWGGIDVLVNNAGLHRGGRIDRIDDADFASVLDTNVSGPFNAVRACLPHFPDAGGAIVNIGAVVGFRGFAGDVAYGTSKMALEGMTKVLAVELARRGIRVNLVLPGFVSTEMTAELSPTARESIVQDIPLRREGTPEEIAQVVWWVAQSRYMTGSTIATDGGLMARL
ncbi:SDR family NAD(P)-dependent oxidoreductase [Croceicoccus sp. BE223]|uniref:SDR family NAD(P)-dependent oxidoreductase n=1 Tax=Croceicoccus sp. BE223 TaxID=2817716 RepID=UPI002859146E|nr:SDR family NAD(P)-dependent oxidoreductase [Croceicoccus sp. BE223]MDR7101117.1 NAD(P)-dependent dehydrogenase (short-subunit alcohol dehydrogenase family) [Croceicoccus sp. BE223]